MTKINLRRVILGGILGGLVMDILGYAVDGRMLASEWTAEMHALGHSTASNYEIAWMNILGVICGVVAVYLFAAMRPRFGGGTLTAIRAGLIVWVVGSLIPNASFMYLSGLFSQRLAVLTTAGSLVGTLIGTIVGAAFYKEANASVPAPLPRSEQHSSV
jgi:hypothetical protein